MLQQLRLRRATRLWLAWLDRKARDADLRVRCRVLLKIHAGKSPHTAAREIEGAPWTACRIVARFRANGESSVFDGRGGNGHRKVSPEVLCEIVAFLRTNWTLELLAKVIDEKLAVTLSPGHVWKVVKQMGVRWGRCRPVVCCPW